ncbi:PQQ-dependent sugar dehydrogenase [Spirosoma horti]
MNQPIMLSKTIIAFLISLTATSGVAWIVAAACQSSNQSNSMTPDSTGSTNTGTLSARVVNAYPKLTFSSPVEYTHANDGTNRVFVIEQEGKIRVFENDANTATAGTYLDIRNKVASGGEMGLLGLAFHPDFKQNGFFYVNYTKSNPRETVVSRFKASSATASQVDPASEVILFRFAQPYANHNGGKTLFGPDGFLYVSTGDGGSGGDPQNNGQNKSSWLGKILRVDVNSTEKGHYGIPADNPFKGNSKGYREEIFAYGLRNPWRVSFDDEGRLWAGDVGQDKIEEVDIITKGGNYGWRIKEANADYNAKENAVPEAELIPPVYQYSHSKGDVSITGGVVYGGSANPSLRGKYIFADYASGRLWALTPNGNKTATAQELMAQAGAISAFGEDQKKEIYLCDLGTGKILKLVGN